MFQCTLFYQFSYVVELLMTQVFDNNHLRFTEKITRSENLGYGKPRPSHLGVPTKTAKNVGWSMKMVDLTSTGVATSNELKETVSRKPSSGRKGPPMLKLTDESMDCEH